MKKIILILIISIFICLPVSAITWLNCPFGQTNDPYPGLCARYTDTDGDNICDNSQLPPAERVTGTTQSPNQPRTTVKYYVVEITIILLLFYSLSKYLVYLSKQSQNKFLQKFNYRNVKYGMNIALLISFLTTCCTSFIILAQLQLGWFENTTINFSWLHIESGLVMIIIALLHLLERWRFFVKV